MTNITDIREMKARIVVFGVGGAGGNLAKRSQRHRSRSRGPAESD